jgi:hypothetical protein
MTVRLNLKLGGLGSTPTQPTLDKSKTRSAIMPCSRLQETPVSGGRASVHDRHGPRPGESKADQLLGERSCSVSEVRRCKAVMLEKAEKKQGLSHAVEIAVRLWHFCMHSQRLGAKEKQPNGTWIQGRWMQHDVEFSTTLASASRSPVPLVTQKTLPSRRLVCASPTQTSNKRNLARRQHKQYVATRRHQTPVARQRQRSREWCCTSIWHSVFHMLPCRLRIAVVDHEFVPTEDTIDDFPRGHHLRRSTDPRTELRVPVRTCVQYERWVDRALGIACLTGALLISLPARANPIPTDVGERQYLNVHRNLPPQISSPESLPFWSTAPS